MVIFLLGYLPFLLVRFNWLITVNTPWNRTWTVIVTGRGRDLDHRLGRFQPPHPPQSLSRSRGFRTHARIVPLDFTSANATAILLCTVNSEKKSMKIRKILMQNCQAYICTTN